MVENAEIMVNKSLLFVIQDTCYTFVNYIEQPCVIVCIPRHHYRYTVSMIINIGSGEGMKDGDRPDYGKQVTTHLSTIFVNFLNESISFQKKSQPPLDSLNLAMSSLSSQSLLPILVQTTSQLAGMPHFVQESISDLSAVCCIIELRSTCNT